MPRASSPCSTPGCPNLKPCAQHKPTPWANTASRKRGWDRQRINARILATHGGICHVCHRPGATLVDHVIPLAQGGADTDDNKRPIHPRPCHQTKTQAEAAQGRRR